MIVSVRLASLKTAEGSHYTPQARILAIRSSRRKLYDSLVEWVERLQVLDESLWATIPPIDFDHPENTVLPLPTRLQESARTLLYTDAMVVADETYRELQMNAILISARGVVFDQEAGYQAKDLVTGQRANTRLGTVVNSFKLEKTSIRAQYNHARRMVLNVTKTPEKYAQYKVLTEKDMHCRHLQKERKSGKGKGKHGDSSWLWEVLKPSGMSVDQEAAWQTECERPSFPLLPLADGRISVRRANWMNDKAALDRGIEEAEILVAEYGRMIRSYERYMLEWGGIADELKAARRPGAEAYARRRRALYVYLKRETETHWARAYDAATFAIEQATGDGVVADLGRKYVRYIDADHPRRQELAENAAVLDYDTEGTDSE